MMKSKSRKLLKIITLVICILQILFLIPLSVFAASGTINENDTSNNSYTGANRTYDDYDNYGKMNSASDVDWWVVRFNYSGKANFYLGNIPTGCDYDLKLYENPTSTLATKTSVNTGNADELITHNVIADTDYYIKVQTWSSYSTTQNYLLRVKIYPEYSLSVPLYQQQTSNTCGCASGRMMLAYYGYSVSETAFKAKADYYASVYGGNFTYVYIVNYTLNYYLEYNGNSARYTHVDVSSYDNVQFQNIIAKNLSNSHPVQPQLCITDSNYFPYTSSGHYVVLSGMNYNTSTQASNSTIKDSHPTYYNTYTVPLSSILSYTKSKAGFIICVDT